MPSTSAPSEFDAVLYDGETATPHPARVALELNGLWVRHGASAERLATAELRLGDAMPGRTVLRHILRPDWRLTLAGDLPTDWRRAVARAGRPSRDKVAIWTAAGAAVIGAIALLFINGNAVLEGLAPLVPHSVTEPVGQQIVSIFAGAKRCEAPAGRVALQKLMAQLQPEQGFVEPVTLHVVDSPIVNAMTTPGGHVLIFSQLIEEAESPDELAGVLAHELGHVQHRHPTQALIRHFGVSVLLSSLGGDIASAADLMLVLHRTRDAEYQADTWTIENLRRAGISTAGLAAFFKRRLDEEGTSSKSRTEEILDTADDYLATHPASAERMARFLAADLPPNARHPALSATDWQALREICGKRKDK